MIDFKITKRTKILEVNCDKCHNYYYLIQGRLYNDEKTKYKKFGFVLWFDIFDLQEYYEKEIIYKSDILNYVYDLEYIPLEQIKSYSDEKSMKEFYNYCNETIKNYNKLRG
jgi:hypothetical protein